MKLKRSLLAFVLAFVLVLTAAGCQEENTDWSAEYQGERLASGVYILHMMTAYNEASTKVQESSSSSSSSSEDSSSSSSSSGDVDVLTAEIDGVSGSQWIINRTQELVKEYYAVEDKFDELGLALDEEDEDNIRSTVENAWSSYQDYYEQNGIGKASLTLVVTNSAKSQKIFESIYYEGGTDPVSQEEINEQLLQDVSKVTFFSMPLTNDDGDAMSDEEKTQAREQVQGFVDRVNAGEDIDTVIAEYEGEESTHDHTQEGVHDLVIYQDTMQNYYTYGTLFSDELMEAAFSGEYGVAQLVEDSSNLYMILRKDVREDADLLESMTPTIIEELKGDAFDETIAQWGTEVTGVTFNGDAVNYYTPDKLNFES